MYALMMMMMVFVYRKKSKNEKKNPDCGREVILTLPQRYRTQTSCARFFFLLLLLLHCCWCRCRCRCGKSLFLVLFPFSMTIHCIDTQNGITLDSVSKFRRKIIHFPSMCCECVCNRKKRFLFYFCYCCRCSLIIYNEKKVVKQHQQQQWRTDRTVCRTGPRSVIVSIPKKYIKRLHDHIMQQQRTSTQFAHAPLISIILMVNFFFVFLLLHRKFEKLNDSRSASQVLFSGLITR